MDFLNKVLKALNISKEMYQDLSKETSLDDIEDPKRFNNIEKAIERIEKAINNNEKIIIYGDYDCDGISSVSILVETFKKLKYPVGYYIPSRYKDGFGINEEMVNEIYKKDYSLIITVDNGVSQFSALQLAKNYNIDVILTDHHEMINGIPTCYTIVHPFLKDDNILPECGAYVAFMISILLLKRIDPYLLSLATLATLSDMMPLVGYNRILVKEGLKAINNNHFNQFIMLTKDDVITEKTLSYVIAPKINAMGRIVQDTSVNKVIKFFTSDKVYEQIQLGNLIESINDERKSLCLEAFNSLDLKNDENDYVIVKYIPSLCEGLIGLVASRILNEINRPVIVFTKCENQLLKGSGRSLDGFSLSDSFKELEDIIEIYGGHALAGGLSIKEENLDEFTRRINFLAKGKTIKQKSKIIIPLEEDEFNYNNYQIIHSLSPFGEGFIEPYFSYVLETSTIQFAGNNLQHIRGRINYQCSYIGFNIEKSLLNCNKVELIGKIDLDHYRGGNNITFSINEIRRVL